jgi:hemerythrin-like domain-containing protein
MSEAMKRHKSLYPLSHDHHHALVQARQLSLASAQAGQDVPVAAAVRFIEFWEAILQKHFRQEEEILLPVLEKYVAQDCAEIAKTLSQHEELRRLIAALNGELAQRTGIDTTLLGQVGSALADHIRFEENALFPLIEASVPEQALWQINERLTRDEGLAREEI